MILGAFTDDVSNPGNDRGPAQFFKNLDARKAVPPPNYLAWRHGQALDEYRDIGSKGRQLASFELKAARRDIAQHGMAEMLTALDMGNAADFEPGHDPPLRRLAYELAIQKRDDVDRIVEPNPKLAAIGPSDLSSWTLPGGDLDRHAFAERGHKVAAYRRSERRDLPDTAFAAHAQMVDCRRIEWTSLNARRRIIGPREAISHDDSCD